MHSSTQISHVSIIFDADSEFKVRFPRLWLFTFSQNEVWIQPFHKRFRIKQLFPPIHLTSLRVGTLAVKSSLRIRLAQTLHIWQTFVLILRQMLTTLQTIKTREQNNSGGQKVVSEQSHGLTRVSKSILSVRELLDLRSSIWYQTSADEDSETPDSSVSSLSDRTDSQRTALFFLNPDGGQNSSRQNDIGQIIRTDSRQQTDTGHKRDKDRTRTVLSADVFLIPLLIPQISHGNESLHSWFFTPDILVSSGSLISTSVDSWFSSSVILIAKK